MTMPMVCTEQQMSDTTYVPEDAARIALLKGKKWNNGSQLHYAFRGGTDGQRKKFQQTVEEMARYANLDFSLKPANVLVAEIRVTFDPNGGAWSYIGTDCAKQPSKQPTMNLGFGFNDGQDGTYMHELGHAIGAIHEHQNPRGGIKWNEAQVIKDLSGPPNNWDRETIQHNMFEKYAVDQLNADVFDPKSIMLYAIPKSWTMDGFSSSANAVLSPRDIAWIIAQYPGRAGGGGGGTDPPPVPVDALEIPVHDLSPVYADISKPGERDLVWFPASRAGRYRIEALGGTPVSLRLFGPNSETNLVKEVNNATLPYNARMDAALNPGKYYVQISHLQDQGIGPYGIRVICLAEQDSLADMVGEIVITGICPVAPGNYVLAKK